MARDGCDQHCVASAGILFEPAHSVSSFMSFPILGTHVFSLNPVLRAKPLRMEGPPGGFASLAIFELRTTGYQEILHVHKMGKPGAPLTESGFVATYNKSKPNIDRIERQRQLRRGSNTCGGTDSMKDWITVLRAADMAARWHVRQRRKGIAQEPYINHLLEVASLVTEATGGIDPTVVIAALLHDAIEDQGVTSELLASEFGQQVTGIVLEVSDDKSLPKRKSESAGSSSTPGQKAVKPN